MKKVMIFVLAFFSMVPLAFADQVVLTCKTAQVLADIEEPTDPIKYDDVEFNLVVSKDSQTQYGYRADFTMESKAVVETDTNYETMPFDQNDENLVEMIQFMRPDLVLSDITTVGYANIGVKANADDQAGIALWDLFDKSGKSLGKVGLLGWALAKCD